MNGPFTSSRRELLKGTGALIVSFSLGEWRGGALAQELPSAKSVALDQVDTFLAIDGRGMVDRSQREGRARDRREHRPDPDRRRRA